MNQQPPQPGWWQASDGRWYPPQPPQQGYGAPVMQAGPPRRSRSGSGCLVGCLVALVVVVAVGAAAAFFAYRFVVDTADKLMSDVECPSASTVSDIVGSEVKTVAEGTIFVASGCSYEAVDADSGVNVQITSGSSIIEDDVRGEFETTAEGQGASVESADVGEDGKKFGSEIRSGALAGSGGQVVEVEVWSANLAKPIGDKSDAAVELLREVVE
ncbi:cysteine-rich/transmembrane domain-containing protein [Nocardioides speluncae]|uniref:cysteine-rich/transmembrane domain-containing protein n=1 Tax=Nocardioides speluncae TaxID=2670337 RepID=UPI000D69A7F0|nr:cysteine-rich/transmembrane domain-containing protein [Nocardioides speluncae]